MCVSVCECAHACVCEIERARDDAPIPSKAGRKFVHKHNLDVRNVLNFPYKGRAAHCHQEQARDQQRGMQCGGTGGGSEPVMSSLPLSCFVRCEFSACPALLASLAQAKRAVCSGMSSGLGPPPPPPFCSSRTCEVGGRERNRDCK